MKGHVMNAAYTPPQHFLDNYARVLIRFALNSGKGIKKGDVVYLVGSEATKPLFLATRREIWKAGGHVIGNFLPANSDRYQSDRDFFECAAPHQLDWTPHHYFSGLIAEMDHQVFILGDENPHALEGIDPKKIMRRGVATKPFMEMRTEKENRRKLTWTLCLYGTPAMAAEAGLSEQAYWKEIINACYLNEDDPVRAWKDAFKLIEQTRKKLNAITPKIDRLHVQADSIDLWITPGERRQWLGGSGRNIPSFELFLSPDRRGTEGHIAFDMPLYRYGNLIEGIELWFEDGRVVKSKATKNERVLKEMIATEGADRVGEFSLTDKRVSRIGKFMAETLYDENFGGRYGNTHIALGKSYHDSLDGDPSMLSKHEWEKLGFNDSSVHTDIISTSRRTVTASMKDGSERVIYKDGEFTL